MKVTKRQLRQLIKKEVSKRNLRQLVRESMAMGRGVELTDGDATEASISAAWPDKVYYKGEPVFQTFYSDEVMNTVWEYVENSGYDDGQEAYLGYSPAADIFVMGFDAWPERSPDGDQEGDMEGVIVQLTPDGRPLALSAAGGGMYPGGRSAAKRKFPDIIDVRLD